MWVAKSENRKVRVIYMFFVMLCATVLMKISCERNIVTIEDEEVPHNSGEGIEIRSIINEKKSTGYVYTQGTSLFLDGEEYIIQGVCASNGVAASPKVYDVDMMREEDYKEIAALGMNTVRFLINYDLLEDDNNLYVYKETGWNWIDMNLTWAEKYGIHIILDCHLSQGGIPSNGGNYGIWGTENEKQERLVAMWRAIAERYCNNTTVLGYGLLNEPLLDSNKENDWHELANRLKNTVRSIDKKHVLFIQRAWMESEQKYIYPEIEDDNWVLEIHEYPAFDMKLIKSYFEIPKEYLFYGNNAIVTYRKNVIEKGDLCYTIANNQPKISNQWVEYSYTFSTPEDVNHAYILFEILNLGNMQEIQISDVSVCKNDEAIYNLKNNIKNQYSSYASSENAKIEYISSNDLIRVVGQANYISIADCSFFRFFKLEEKTEYILKFKLRATTGLKDTLRVNAKIRCYNAEKICVLNEGFLEYLLNSDELSLRYGVPIFYGEVGMERYGYEVGRAIEQLSNDMINWLVDNRCNFTWFTWHEPNYGMYTSPGLEPKNNPNTLLLEQMERALKRK